jgi:hypothetical protein
MTKRRNGQQPYSLSATQLTLSKMTDIPMSELPTETLQQLEAECSEVVVDICHSLLQNFDLVDAIRSLMQEKDTEVAIHTLRDSNPALANRLVIAALGVLVNTVNLTSIQDELQKRIRDSN